MRLNEKLNEIIKLGLPKEYTAISYAIMVDGEIWCADTLGTSEGKPATTDHTFNVGSISKIFCTTAVMQLVEQGKMDLDEPICTYLPDLWMPDARYKKITVRHCLNHSCGLPGTQWKNFCTSEIQEGDIEAYYQEVYHYLAHSWLKAEPGEYSVYCNDGFTLAEMAVAAVTGQPFCEYCEEYITRPLGAHSTRTAFYRNPDYPLTVQNTKPSELIWIQGCGGITTNMIDLCKFGNMFLTDSPVLSKASKAEMAKHQGISFLPEDTASTCYGLGWDQVAFKDPDIEMGEGVLMKGGGTFQFISRLLVLPEYNAVLAMSRTIDCKVDVALLLPRLFAAAMLEKRGINLYKAGKVIPQEFRDKFGGDYLTAGGIYHTHFDGDTLTTTWDSLVGGREFGYKDLRFNGEYFVSADGERHFFKEHGEDIYLFETFRGRTIPAATKARDRAPLSEVWKARLGKKYLPVDNTFRDIVSNEMMCGLTIAPLAGYEGLFIAAFSDNVKSGGGDRFESCCTPIDDDHAESVMRTPSNGSRDAFHPWFERRDGVEYCVVGSYLFRDADSLPEYKGEDFSTLPEQDFNHVFRITEALEHLPSVPAGRRLMVRNCDLLLVYDSMLGGDFKPVKDGFISFV